MANVQSINNKKSELSTIIENENIDIVLLTETWTTSDTSDSEITFPNFQVVSRTDKNTVSGIGGGQIILARKNLILVDQTPSNQTADLQVGHIQMPCGLNIINVYRSPTNNDNAINKIANIIGLNEKDCILLGDINLPEIDWESMESKGGYGGTSITRSSALIEKMLEGGYEQLVTFPTRFATKSDLSAGRYKWIPVHDIIITNSVAVIQNVCENTSGGIGNSDHIAVSFEIMLPNKKASSTQYIPNYHKADFNSLKESLSEHLWSNLLEPKTANESWNIVQKSIEDAAEKYIPKKLRRSKNKSPWITNASLKAISDKRKAFKKMKLSIGSEHFSDNLADYKRSAKKSKKSISSARKKYERKLTKMKKQNPKPFYQYMSNFTKVKSNIGPLKDSGGSLTSDPKSMATILNKFFISQFTTITADSDLPEIDILPCQSPLTTVDFNTVSVLKELKNIKVSTAPGPDGITARILKECAVELAEPISLVLQKSISESKIPTDLKFVNVTPILKKKINQTQLITGQLQWKVLF